MKHYYLYCPTLLFNGICPILLQMAGTVDVFPTLMNLVGGKLPNVTLDGVDMAPILFDSKKVFYFLSSDFSIHIESGTDYRPC